MSPKVVTSCMVVLWVLQLPIVIFLPKYSNCWYYAVKNKLRYGGKIFSLESKRWAGHHFMWLSPEHELWEYTYPDMPENTPWYKLLIYKGKIRKIPGRDG